MSAPYINAVPEVVSSIPVSMKIAVVFPAPLCPRMVKISPLLIERVSLFTAVKAPNFLVKF